MGRFCIVCCISQASVRKPEHQVFQAERYLIQEMRFQRCWKDWVGEGGAGNVVLSEDLAVPEATPPCGSLHKTAATTFTGALRGSSLSLSSASHPCATGEHFEGQGCSRVSYTISSLCWTLLWIAGYLMSWLLPIRATSIPPKSLW